MKLSDKVNAVKQLLKEVFTDTIPAASETVAADALKDYVTETGATVKIDKLEVGGKVYQEDGTTPQTAGFSLSDGTVVTVDESGVILTVVVPSPIIAAVDPAPVNPVPAPANYDARFEALEAKLAELQASAQKFSDATATDAKLQKVNEAITKTLEIVEAFAAAPSADPVTIPAGNPDKPTKADLRESFAKNIAARKKTAV